MHAVLFRQRLIRPLFYFEHHAAGINRQHGMPGKRRHLQYFGFFTQQRALGDDTFLIKLQYHKAAAQRCQQFPGLWMAVRSNIGARFHGNRQSLHRLAQLVV
ncbi:hypothetical protein D3C71_1740180 [compost metagenome]